MVTDFVIRDEELKSLLHPTETSRYILAVVVAVPATALLIFFVVMTKGQLLVVLLSALVTVWFTLRLLKAHLMGSAVRVSRDNFPEIHEVLMEVKQRLNYHKEVEVYITAGESFNAFLYKFFQTKFILLHADVVAGIPLPASRAQMVWLLARFVGALKAKHLRLDFLTILVTSIEQLQVLKFFFLPYERATQYSGDQIGLELCGDLASAIKAFDKLLVGEPVSHSVQLKGLLQQAYDMRRSLFGFLVKLLSTHPHMTDRYLNLLAFARYRHPEQFAQYVSQFENIGVTEIENLLPRYFPVTQPLPQPQPLGRTGEVFPAPEAGRPGAVLRGVDGPMTGKYFPVEKWIFRIGANPENDLVVTNDPFVSGDHAWLCYTEGTFLVVDRKSRNGTKLNGNVVAGDGERLRPGDRLQIGESAFEVSR